MGRSKKWLLCLAMHMFSSDLLSKCNIHSPPFQIVFLLQQSHICSANVCMFANRGRGIEGL